MIFAGLADFLAVGGEPVLDGAPGAGDALDKTSRDHARRERAHRLVSLEGEPGQGVQRCARLLAEMAQHVPLHQRHAEPGQALVSGAVMAPLQALDSQPDVLQGRSHQLTISTSLYKLSYINILI